MTTNRALLIVDVQQDFCEGGALAVAGGNAVARKIAGYLSGTHPHEYDLKIASMDWHNALPNTNAGHFALEGEPDYAKSWPVHCVGGTPGSDLHPALESLCFDELVRKGRGCQSYSAFEGVTWDGQRTLLAALRTAEINEIDVCGIATDFCVAASARDGQALGFSVRLLSQLCAGVSEESTSAAFADMKARGIEIV